jgi:acyl-CoA thioesterase-2
MSAPIIYDVDRSRDGGSFSVRRVVAIQHGRPIFNLAASFQVPEHGLEHHSAMPKVEGPDGLPDLTEVAPQMLDKIPEKMHRYLTIKRPFEFRPVQPMEFMSLEPRPAVKHVWIKTVDGLPDEQSLHQNLLAYVSDYELLGTSTLPHGLPFGQGRVMMASLDHALWFHRDVRVDDWLLYSMDSPNSSGARGFARGQFFNREGALVASSTQEGLVRVLAEDATYTKRSDPKKQE